MNSYGLFVFITVIWDGPVAAEYDWITLGKFLLPLFFLFSSCHGCSCSCSCSFSCHSCSCCCSSSFYAFSLFMLVLIVARSFLAIVALLLLFFSCFFLFFFLFLFSFLFLREIKQTHSCSNPLFVTTQFVAETDCFSLLFIFMYFLAVNCGELCHPVTVTRLLPPGYCLAWATGRGRYNRLHNYSHKDRSRKWPVHKFAPIHLYNWFFSGRFISFSVQTPFPQCIRKVRLNVFLLLLLFVCCCFLLLFCF